MASASAGSIHRTLALAAALVLTAASAAQAAEAWPCATSEEAAAIRLRHLQSRLMVAALGCNQQDAYNGFVEHFRSDLVVAGGRIADYFERRGGQFALNRHVTELANAAGLSRAEDPDGFCKTTWQLFWNLEQDPPALVRIAEVNVLPAVQQPMTCPVTTGNQTASAPGNAAAAFEAAETPAKPAKK